MKYAAQAAAAAVIYVAFVALIGGAVYWLHSAMPLWALLLTPTIKFGTED